MAFGSSASRGNNPVKERARSLFIPDRNYVSPNISRTPTADPREFCRAGRLLERNFRNMQENRLPGERPDRTQPPGYRSEPHLDFIVTDLDGMLAQLCGPDRKIIRLRDKRGIYLFLIEITAITKYLADADGGSRRILRSRPDCWS